MPPTPPRGWAGLLPEEIAAGAGLSPAFRGKQAFRWLARGAASWADMTDLPAQERERLDASSPLLSSRVASRIEDPDGTLKLALSLQDGSVVEAVLLVDREGRRTACLSTQVGCPMGCAFCKTGTLGFARNLSASEIVEQLLALNRGGERASNVVFMGMGEPLLNIAELRRSVEVIRHPEGLAMGSRKITVSTCGVVAGILALARGGPHVRLAVSLTAADPAKRALLMPVEAGNPLPELKRALIAYQEATGDRITLEAAVLGGVNSGKDDARAMAAFCAGLNAQINLIPWNPVPGLPFREPAPGEVASFAEELERLGLNVTRRARRGRGVSGACGQLGGLAEAMERDFLDDGDE